MLWPAFVVSASNDFLKKNATALRTALQIVATCCQKLKNGHDSASFISDACGISPADARRWLAGLRWTNNFEPHTPALVSQGAIDPSTTIDEVWYSD